MRHLVGILVLAVILPGVVFGHGFDDVELSHVFLMLEKIKGDKIKIQYDPEEVKGIIVSALYENVTVDDVLTDLLPPQGFTFTKKTDDDVTVYTVKRTGKPDPNSLRQEGHKEPSLSPLNARLLTVTAKCMLWMRTERNPYTGGQYTPRGWRHHKTVYSVVGTTFTNTFTTTKPFHEKTSVLISDGGSLQLGDGRTLLSAADAAKVTEGDKLGQIRFNSDIRKFDSWEIAIEWKKRDPKAQAGEAQPVAVLSFTTPRIEHRDWHYGYKKGCRIAVFDYKYKYKRMSKDDIKRRHYGLSPNSRANWRTKWPVRRLSMNRNHVTVWNGRMWKVVPLGVVTKMAASVNIDFFTEDRGRRRRWRIIYRLNDEGGRSVSRVGMATAKRYGGVSTVLPGLTPVDQTVINAIRSQAQELPPSVDVGLTNAAVRITIGGDTPTSRTYPLDAVPAAVVGILDRMGGLQYEAKSLLKVRDVKEEKDGALVGAIE